MASDVAVTIRAKIVAGLLPLPQQAPDKVYVGQGTGKLCDGCDGAVTEADREYEVDLPDRTLRLHAKCLAAWHEARINGPS